MFSQIRRDYRRAGESHAELGKTAEAEAALRKLLAAGSAASFNLIRDLHSSGDIEVLERENEALQRLRLSERSAGAASL